MNPFYFIQMLPYASLTLFIVGSIFFAMQFYSTSSFPSLIPMACFAALRTFLMSLFVPILTFFSIAGFLDTFAMHDGGAQMRLLSGVCGVFAFCLLLALNFGTSFGLTMLTTRVFNGMVALRDPANLYWSIVWLLGLESVAVTCGLVLQLVFAGNGPYVT